MKEILVVTDIQKEYQTKGRPFYLNGMESSLIKTQVEFNNQELHQAVIEIFRPFSQSILE